MTSILLCFRWVLHHHFWTIRNPLIDYLSSNLVSSELVNCIVASSDSKDVKYGFREEQPEGQRLATEADKTLYTSLLVRKGIITRAIEICSDKPKFENKLFWAYGDGNIHFNISTYEGINFFRERRGLSKKNCRISKRNEW